MGAGIGENLPSATVAVPLLRAGADPQFELPRVSGRETELFCGPLGAIQSSAVAKRVLSD